MRGYYISDGCAKVNRHYQSYKIKQDAWDGLRFRANGSTLRYNTDNLLYKNKKAGTNECGKYTIYEYKGTDNFIDATKEIKTGMPIDRDVLFHVPGSVAADAETLKIKNQDPSTIKFNVSIKYTKIERNEEITLAEQTEAILNNLKTKKLYIADDTEIIENKIKLYQPKNLLYFEKFEPFKNFVRYPDSLSYVIGGNYMYNANIIDEENYSGLLFNLPNFDETTENLYSYISIGFPWTYPTKKEKRGMKNYYGSTWQQVEYDKKDIVPNYTAINENRILYLTTESVSIKNEEFIYLTTSKIQTDGTYSDYTIYDVKISFSLV